MSDVKRTIKGLLLEMKLAPTTEEKIIAEETILNEFEALRKKYNELLLSGGPIVIKMNSEDERLLSESAAIKFCQQQQKDMQILQADIRRSELFRKIIEDKNFYLSKDLVAKDAEIQRLKDLLSTVVMHLEYPGQYEDSAVIAEIRKALKGGG